MQKQQEEAGALGVRGVETDDFLKVERHGLEPIPDAERHGSPRELGLVWAGAMSNYLSLLTGALVVGAVAVGQLGIVDSAIAIIIGAGLAGILHGLIGVTGARAGTPQMVFSRGVLGHRGAYLGALFTWLMAVGWFAIDSVIGGWALVQLLNLAGVPKSTPVAMLCITFVLAASVVVAVFGHQTVHVFEKYGSIVFLAFCALLFIVLFPQIHWSFPTTLHGGTRLGAMVIGGSFIYALVASWIPFAGDYSRYQPRNASTKGIAFWSGLGISLPTAVLGILGVALFTINSSQPDLLTTIRNAAPGWLAVPFFLFVVLGEIWANYFDVYTAGLVALAMDVPLRRWWSALLCGGIGAVAVYFIGVASNFTRAQTYSDLVNNFLGVYVNFLLLTYLWVPAWAAVLLVDFFFLRRGRYATSDLTAGRQGRYWYRGGVFWRALLAWIVGVLATIPFIGAAYLPGGVWQGPAAHWLGGADISGIVGALVAGVIYYVVGKPYFRSAPADATDVADVADAPDAMQRTLPQPAE